MTTTTTDRPAGDDADSPSSPWTWLLPVLTFLLGCLLGGGIVAAGAFDGEELAAPDAVETPDPGEDGASPTPTPDDLVVRVPESCLELADRAAAASEQVEQVVAAVRDLDARRLQEIVDTIQQMQPELQQFAEQCRALAGEQLQDGQLVTPTPAATPAS